MSTEKEQEAFSLVIERHKEGSESNYRKGSENDIRTAFQRFMEATGIASIADTKTEIRPGMGKGRMDLYVYNTCIEFKRDILQRGTIGPEHIAQLDGYLKELVKAGTGVQNGILTDGVNYLIRRPGDDRHPCKRAKGTPFSTSRSNHT